MICTKYGAPDIDPLLVAVLMEGTVSSRKSAAAQYVEGVDFGLTVLLTLFTSHPPEFCTSSLLHCSIYALSVLPLSDIPGPVYCHKSANDMIEMAATLFNVDCVCEPHISVRAVFMGIDTRLLRNSFYVRSSLSENAYIEFE